MRPFSIEKLYGAGIVALLCLLSCTACEVRIQSEAPSRICLECSSSETKAGAVAENTIWDVNLFIFGYGGILEQHKFTRFPQGRQNVADVEVDLLANRDYTVYAFANAGYDMGCLDKEYLEDFRFHLQRADMSSYGVPMSGKTGNVRAEDGSVHIGMKRLASKVTVCLDRSRLDKDVDFHISGVKVGNSPRWARAFSPSAISDRDDCFPSGYYSSGSDVTELYLLENLQGQLNADLCSYVELDIDYASDKYYTDGKNGLIYRFYLREGNSFMVQRNCHYTVTVCPEKDGLLCDDAWRVDKSRLIAVEDDAYLRIVPGGSTIDDVYYEHYYEMERGGNMHFDLSFAPRNMTVKLREDLVLDELEDGRAEYTMDANGRGFTVRSIGGSGLSMMEIVAEGPLNDSETIAVYID